MTNIEEIYSEVATAEVSSADFVLFVFLQKKLDD